MVAQHGAKLRMCESSCVLNAGLTCDVTEAHATEIDDGIYTENNLDWPTGCKQECSLASLHSP